MKIPITSFLLLCAFHVFAQKVSYTSKIVDKDNYPVIGATINEDGTSNYAFSDQDGVFVIETSAKNFKLVITSIGLDVMELSIMNGIMPEAIVLESANVQLSEVVVTALGIQRDRQSLSAAVARIDEKALTDVTLTNVVNSLAGQVAGVQVTNGSSGVGSSSRIIIRGENSLSNSNQPLFVVDGVPISNDLIASDLINDGGNMQEVDFGNGSAELNPDDMASITILKGPGSAAIYGTRAANGVVLVTTKRGNQKKGLGISTSSSVTFDKLLTLPDYQNVYGGGSNGAYSFQNGIGAGVNDGGISSYGPRLDAGLLVKQFDSPSVDANGNPVRAGDVIARTLANGKLTDVTATPWVARPNNVRDFFETGATTQNSFALSSTSENTSLRVSYSNLRNKGILPNTNLKRDGIAISFDQKITEKFKLDGFANFINSRSDNRPNLGYGYENVMYGFNWTGRQTNLESLKEYWQAGQTGIARYDFNYLWLNNPYLTLQENTNAFNKNRVLGNMALSYEFTPKLSLRVRNGIDTYADNRYFKRAFGTNRRQFGGYREDKVGVTEMNTDFLLSYKNEIGLDYRYGIALGGNQQDQTINYQQTEAYQLAVPGVYALSNSRVPLRASSQKFSKAINSIYAIGNMSYQSSLYFDFTLRNDWSSTLPNDNNSFAYYSAGVSYVMSNMFDLPDPISYLKATINVSSVGNDTDPYQLENTFRFNQNYGSNFRLTNEPILKNANLKPERLNAVEGGLEAWFAKDRLQFNASVYQNTSVNQIIGRPISYAGGFSNVIENGGEVRTRGVELSLRASMVKLKNFEWLTSVNFSRYRSVVTKLPQGVDQYVTGFASVFLGSGGSNTVFYIAKENGRVGDMYGTGFVQVDGKTLFNASGFPVQDNKLRLLGNYNPDFSIGVGNEVRYKGVTLSFLFDGRIGGTIVSRTKALGSTSGVLEETLVGREGGVIGDGVVNVGTADAPKYEPNTKSVPASQYYNNFFDRGNEASALYDASYVKLRQVSLYYNMSRSIANRIGFQNIKLGIVGSNLLLFTQNPHFDPELNMLEGRNLTYGVEDMSYPSTRSFGFSLKTQF